MRGCINGLFRLVGAVIVGAVGLMICMLVLGGLVASGERDNTVSRVDATDVPEDDERNSIGDEIGKPTDAATRIATAISDDTSVQDLEVRVADGRDVGGERSVIVSYVSSVPDSVTMRGADLLSVTLAINDAVLEHEIDLDTVVLIWADPDEDDGVAMAVWALEDVIAFWADEIDADTFFLERMQ